MKEDEFDKLLDAASQRGLNMVSGYTPTWANEPLDPRLDAIQWGDAVYGAFTFGGPRYDELSAADAAITEWVDVTFDPPPYDQYEGVNLSGYDPALVELASLINEMTMMSEDGDGPHFLHAYAQGDCYDGNFHPWSYTGEDGQKRAFSRLIRLGTAQGYTLKLFIEGDETPLAEL